MPRPHAAPVQAAQWRRNPSPGPSPRLLRPVYPNLGRRTAAGRWILRRPQTLARRRLPVPLLWKCGARKLPRPNGLAQMRGRPLPANPNRRSPSPAPHRLALPPEPVSDHPHRLAAPTPWPALVRAPDPGNLLRMWPQTRPIPFSVAVLLFHPVRQQNCRRSQAVLLLRAFPRWRGLPHLLNRPDFAAHRPPGRHRPGRPRPFQGCRLRGAVHSVSAAHPTSQYPAATPPTRLHSELNPIRPYGITRPPCLPERPRIRPGLPASTLPNPARATRSPPDPADR